MQSTPPRPKTAQQSSPHPRHRAQTHPGLRPTAQRAHFSPDRHRLGKARTQGAQAGAAQPRRCIRGQGRAPGGSACRGGRLVRQTPATLPPMSGARALAPEPTFTAAARRNWQARQQAAQVHPREHPKTRPPALRLQQQDLRLGLRL